MVLEFPTSRNGWRLDAVGLLAVIGETTTETCAEPMTASYFCLLPRLIPAPQALIRPNRRITLPSVDASVSGVYSNLTMSYLSYIANQIYPISNLETFSVRVLEVKYRRREPVEMESMQHSADDLEHPTPVRRVTGTERLRTYLGPKKPMMRAKVFSPHNILSVASTRLTIGLLAWAIIIEDGPAAIAIVLLACATSLFCAASLWSPTGSLPRISRYPPKGDVVIRTKQGAFILVQCSDEIARELYSGFEHIEQVITTGFGSCVGAGTVIFMVAVILMGNASWTMQAALAVTYLMLNAIYWFVALMPSATHWEFPRYEWRDVTPPDARDAHEATRGMHIDPTEGRPSYTRSLWYVIRETRKTDWVARNGAAPGTEQWGAWLREAQHAAETGNRSWPAVRRKDEILRENVWSA